MTQTPPDGGTLYTETNMLHVFPEPFNTITSCFFLGIAIYWTFKLWGKFQTHTYLSIALVLLYIGGIGGTVYHGLRQWSVFIMMDWMPIMLLCVSAGVYFLAKVIRWYYAVLIVVAYIGFQVCARNSMGNDPQFFVNLNYAMLAALVLFPVLIYLAKTNWKFGKWVGFALLAFVFALTFRIADRWALLSVGTHFLWHTFGAIAAFCMFNFIYLVNAGSERTVQNKQVSA
ncbi:hypothetical protein C7T94_03500 [Pedobacter yulinensis]|uniref:Hemolysin III n=1 Tax=Pedobacter yulinensis TaxID=2126353 RepID=A0A2T3HRV1_9SPHI|nr:hypothetical protein [Pedobacter yulinensis]PST85182.1 hypothetical protein C7T94_03500 [Pedobacter yulinensis]